MKLHRPAPRHAPALCFVARLLLPLAITVLVSACGAEVAGAAATSAALQASQAQQAKAQQDMMLKKIDEAAKAAEARASAANP